MQTGPGTMKKKLYLSGPMTGLPEFNFPAFNEAAARLRTVGFSVFNPAENGTEKSWEEFMRLDIKAVADSDLIAVLPGWQKSRGAALEVHIARALSMPVLDALTLEPYRESAVQEAHRLVHGDRGALYGHPFDDFSRTGRIWGAILNADGAPVSPDKVALCMVGVKVSREVNKPHRDNRVDLAGYAETLEMVREREGAR